MSTRLAAIGCIVGAVLGFIGWHTTTTDNELIVWIVGGSLSLGIVGYVIGKNR